MPDFKTYYKPTVSKIMEYWHKRKQIDQWPSTQILEIDPIIYGQLRFDKEARTITRKRLVLSKNNTRKKKKKLSLHFAPYTKSTQSESET